MSAVATDYAYVVIEKKDAPPIPAISNEQLAACMATLDKYQTKE